MQGIPATHTPLADTYMSFATLEAAGNCAIYERICAGVAGDAELLGLIETLPLPKRQPNLLLAASRLHGAPMQSYLDYRDWTLAHWGQVSQTMRTRRTQTNEPARIESMTPVLARLKQPLALFEVGASAGLCLYPQSPEIQVAWRGGMDLNPLDVNDPDDVRWLECLVWPSQPHRLERLRRTIEIARADPPHLVRGDLTEDLPLPKVEGATLVVFHTAVLAYVSGEQRAAFAERMGQIDGHWISNEAPGVMHDIDTPRGMIILALDGAPVAFTGPHGQAFQWI